MFDTIFKCLGNDIDALHEVVEAISCLEGKLSEDYIKDQSLKNVAVDAVIAYLQSLKNKK